MGLKRRRLALLMALTMTVTSIQPATLTAMAGEYGEDLLLEEEDAEEQEHVHEDAALSEEQSASYDGALIADDVEAVTESGLVDGLSLEVAATEAAPEVMPETELSTEESFLFTEEEAAAENKLGEELPAAENVQFSVSQEKIEGVAGLWAYEVLKQLNITKTSETGESEIMQYSGYNGNYAYVQGKDGISYYAKLVDADGKTVDFSQGIPEGKYTLQLYKNYSLDEESKVFELANAVDVHKIGSADIKGDLELGKNADLQRADNYTDWYRFVPDTDGRYTFYTGGMYLESVMIDDEDISLSYEGYSDRKVYTLKANKTYYVAYRASQQFDLTIEYLAQIKSVDFAQDRVEGIVGQRYDTLLADLKFTATTGDDQRVNGSAWGGYSSDCYDFRSEKGHMFYVRIVDAENQSVSLYSNAEKGTYSIQVSLTSAFLEADVVGTTTLEVKSPDEIVKGSLHEGENAIEAEQTYQNWYSFTPSVSGRYSLNGFQQMAMIDGANENNGFTEFYNGNTGAYQLTAGTTYYFAFKGEVDGKYQYSVDLQLVPDIKSVAFDADSNVYAEGMTWSDILSNKLPYTVTYTGNTAGENSTAGRSETSSNEWVRRFDSHGNRVYLRAKDKDDKNVDLYTNVVPGTYTIQLAVDSEFTKPVERTLNIVAFEDIPAESIGVGKSTVKYSDGDATYYYKFTADQADDYSIAVQGSCQVWQRNEDGIPNGSWQGSINYDPTKTYYLTFSGWNNEATSTEADIKRIPIIKKAELSSKINWAVADKYTVGEALNIAGVRIDVDDHADEVNTRPYWQTSYVYDPEKGTYVNGSPYAYIMSGLQLYAEIKRDGEQVSASDSLSKGNYTVEFKSKDKVVGTAAFTVKNFDEMQWPVWKLGENKVTSDQVGNDDGNEGFPVYYQFTPDKTARYKISSGTYKKLTEDTAYDDYYNYDEYGKIALYTRNNGEMENFTYRDGERTVALTAGTTYYATFAMASGENEDVVDIYCIPEVAGVSAKSTVDGKTFVEKIDDVRGDIEVTIRYADGTTKTVTVDADGEDEKEDPFGNSIVCTCYQGEKQIGYWGSPEAGTYELRVKVGEFEAKAGTFTVAPAASVVKSVAVEDDLTLNQSDGKFFASFTTGIAGIYRIQTDVRTNGLYVYDEDGRYYEGTDNNYLIMNLPANTTYYVKGEVETLFDTVKVSVDKMPSVSAVSVEKRDVELIAGLDTLAEALDAIITYSDDQIIRLNHGGTDGHGGAAKFYVKEIGEDGVEEKNYYAPYSSYVDAGKYNVYAGAGFASGSSVGYSGSAVVAYDVDSEVTSENSVSVELTLPDVTTLTQLTLDKAQTLPSGVTRKLFGFKAPEDAKYAFNLADQDNATLRFYTSDGKSLVYEGSTVTLKKDEYAVVVARTEQETKFSVTKAVETAVTNIIPKTVEVGKTYAITVGRRDKRNERSVFTPDKDGYYVFRATTKDGGTGDPRLNVYKGKSRQYGTHNYDGDYSFEQRYQMEAGKAYNLEFFGHSKENKFNFTATYLGDKLPKIKKIELVSDGSQWTELDRFSYIYELSITSEDGTVRRMGLSNSKQYWTSDSNQHNYQIRRTLKSSDANKEIYTVEVKGYNTDEETENSKPIVYETEVTMLKMAGLDKLEAGVLKAVTYTVGKEPQSRYYRFTPDADGEYFITNAGNEQAYMNVEVSKDRSNLNSIRYMNRSDGYGSTYSLKKGETYIVQVNVGKNDDSQKTVSGTFNLKVEKVKEIKAISIYRSPEQTKVLPNTMSPDLTGLQVEVTYKDDTKKIVTFGEQEWYEADAYTQYNWLNASTLEVKLTIGYRTTSFKLKADQTIKNNLPTIALNQKTTYTVGVKFTPYKDGNYEFHEETDNYTVKDSYDDYVDYAYDGNENENKRIYYLSAGETYIIENQFKATERTLTIRQINSECEWKVVETKAATCTQEGSRTATCTKHGEQKVVVIPALGHALELVAGKEATCTEAGIKNYWHCKVCNKDFEDAQGKKELDKTKGLVVPAKNHHVIEVEEQKATCTESGTKAHWHCDVCGKNYADKEATKELLEVKVDPLGHHMIHRDAKPATCEEEGNTAYYYCVNCKSYFADALGENDDIEIVMPALGHVWGEPKVTKAATCTETGEQTVTCSRDGETKTEVIPMLEHQWVDDTEKSTASTTEEKGKLYQKCTLCGESRFVHEIPLLQVQEAVDTAISDLETAEAPEDVAKIVKELTAVLNDEKNKADASDIANANKGLEMVSTLEDKLTEQGITVDGVSTPIVIDQTAVEAPEELGTPEVVGAAVTAASVLTAEEVEKHEADATYGAKVEFKDAGETEVEVSSEIKKVYEVDIKLYITKTVDQQVTKISEDPKQLVVPVTIKMDLPEAYAKFAKVAVYHVDENGTETLLDSVRDGNKITFTATSFSPFRIKAVDCGDGNHDMSEEPIASKHKEPTCTETGSDTYKCTRCDYEETTELPTKHSLVHVDMKAATCKEEGIVDHYQCEVCKEYFADEDGEEKLTAKELKIAKLSRHKMKGVKAKPATCTADGNEAYWQCTLCEQFFADEAGKTPIEEDSWIDKATGHKMESVKAKAATCTADGNIAYYHCKSCNKDFRDKDGKDEIAFAGDLIVMKGHKLGYVAAVAATTAKAGNKAHYHCAVCGKNFADAEGKTELKDVTIPKLAAPKPAPKPQPKKIIPTITTNAWKDTIDMKSGQSTKGLKISGLAQGDAIVSITNSNPKAVKLSNINLAAGTCKLKANKLKGKSKKANAVLTIKLKSGLVKTLKIKVQKADVKTKNLKVTTKKIKLKKGKSVNIGAVASPFTTKDKITYTIKGKKIVKVNKKGVIKATKPGKTKIIVKSGKKKVTITVTVTK